MTCRISEMISPAFRDSHKAIKSGAIDELLEKGGRGSTKSSFISIEILLLLIKHPNCHAVVMRKVGNTLRNSVYAQMTWAIDTLGLTSKFKTTTMPMEMTYKPTGQKIMFFGLDDPGKLKSLKTPFGYVGIAWFEELDQFAGEEEIRNIEQSLLRGGSFSFVFKSFNPPAMARNWANRYALEVKPRKLVHHSTYETTPKAWLGDRFISDAENLLKLHPTAYRHEYLGEVVGSGTQVFDNLEIRNVTEEEIQTFGNHYFGQDWGWYPDLNAFNGCSYHAASRTLLVFEECNGCKIPNDQWAQKIRHRQSEIITADPGGGGTKTVAWFRTHGFNMQPAKKGAGSVEYGMKWLQSLAKIVIDPVRCPHTAKEFGEYEYERHKKTGEVLEGYPDASNHHIDAVRYALETVWSRRGK